MEYAFLALCSQSWQLLQHGLDFNAATRDWTESYGRQYTVRRDLQHHVFDICFVRTCFWVSYGSVRNYFGFVHSLRSGFSWIADHYNWSFYKFFPSHGVRPSCFWFRVWANKLRKEYCRCQMVWRWGAITGVKYNFGNFAHCSIP